MFITKIQRDGDEFLVEIPSHEVEAKGFSEGDLIEANYWQPTDEELAAYFEKHPEEREPGL